MSYFDSSTTGVVEKTEVIYGSENIINATPERLSATRK